MNIQDRIYDLEALMDKERNAGRQQYYLIVLRQLQRSMRNKSALGG